MRCVRGASFPAGAPQTSRQALSALGPKREGMPIAIKRKKVRATGVTHRNGLQRANRKPKAFLQYSPPGTISSHKSVPAVAKHENSRATRMAFREPRWQQHP